MQAEIRINLERKVAKKKHYVKINIIKLLIEMSRYSSTIT